MSTKSHTTSSKIFFILAGVFSLLAIFTWNTYQNYSQSPDINKIAIGGMPGCYFQQVQCVKEPCEPVLVCPTPTSSPRMCTMETGKCISKNNQCVTYNNGCEKGDKCRQPTTKCELDDPCHCPPNAMCKLPALCNTPTPAPSAPSSALTFYASDPCGENKFSHITYSCGTNGEKSYSNGQCTNILSAMNAIQLICIKGAK